MSSPSCTGVTAGPVKAILASHSCKRFCHTQVCTDCIYLLSYLELKLILITDSLHGLLLILHEQGPAERLDC